MEDLNCKSTMEPIEEEPLTVREAKDECAASHIQEIVDPRSDEDAVPKIEGTIEGHNGTPQKRKTTKGWSLLVELKNGTFEWLKLKDLKESHPIEVARHARDRGLMELTLDSALSVMEV